MSVLIDLPSHFSLAECLAFLGRSEREVLHRVEDGRLIRPWSSGDRTALLEITQENHRLRVRDLLSDEPLANSADSGSVVSFVRELFDLERDMEPFYAQIRQDPAIDALVGRYSGLRLVRIPDLFETLAWTVIGQQINLGFAYTMKARLVEATGTPVEYQGERRFLFPEPKAVLALRHEDLKSMQYSRQKADYLLHLAEEMASGRLDKADLLALGDPGQQHRRLLKLRGIGPWSADYTLLKCLGVPSAMPIGDVGLHNALRQIHKLKEKPPLEKIRLMAQKWRGWEGYVTFFLWRSLVPS